MTDTTGRSAPVAVPEAASEGVESLLEGLGAERIPVPYAGSEYVCPNCERPIPNRRLVYLSKPPRYANQLHDIVKCCWCRFCFSYRSEAFVVRR